MKSASKPIQLNRISANKWKLLASWGSGLFFIAFFYVQLNHRIADIPIIDWTHIATQVSISLLILSFLLTNLNWTLEIFKWKAIWKNEMNFKQALNNVLTGLYFAVFTPARLGDYFGRSLFAKAQERIKYLTFTFYCSLAQTTVGVTAGLIALLSTNEIHEYLNLNMEISILLIVVIIVLSILLYFIADGLLMYIPWFKKSNFQKIGRLIKIKLLAYSFLRYIVFCSQLAMVLYAFNVQVPLVPMLAGISILFLFQTLIPMPMIFQVATKIQLAILIWSNYSVSAVNVSLALVVIWLMNVIIPAILGYSLFIKKTQNELV